jgi:mono/diheme cytochrome c family protein
MYRRIPIALTLVVITTAAGSSQTPAELARALAQDSIAGRDSFERYCASCHGVDGRGQGPAAAALRSNPPDLTTLTRRNAGTFPRVELRSYVEGVGRSMPAHGTGDMPVWGPIFKGLDPSPERVRIRVQNLVAYVESLQVPPESATAAPTPLTGAQLFRAYCASCHGVDARGAGPLADVLRNVPPSLTEYAIRNNGVFPSERVRQIIDGRHVPAHGDTEMPVWGRAFMREPGGDDATVRARIDALVAYLQSIQEQRAE